MKWLWLFILFPSIAFAQTVNTVFNASVYQAQQNVTIVYDTTSGNVQMVIVDANNLSDPAFNPPGSAQISVPLMTYNTMADGNSFVNYMNTVVAGAMAAAAVQ